MSLITFCPAKGSKPDGDCNICLDTFSKVKRIFCKLECGHSYCKVCLSKHCRSTIGKGEFLCPDMECKKPFNSYKVIGKKHIVLAKKVSQTKESIKKYGSNSVCPVIKCGGKLEKNNNEEDMKCEKCRKIICGICLVSKDSNHICDKKELESMGWKVKNTKPCVLCKSPIQKRGGCPHMKCKACGGEWHWPTDLEYSTYLRLQRQVLQTRGEMSAEASDILIKEASEREKRNGPPPRTVLIRFKIPHDLEFLIEHIRGSILSVNGVCSCGIRCSHENMTENGTCCLCKAKNEREPDSTFSRGITDYRVYNADIGKMCGRCFIRCSN